MSSGYDYDYLLPRNALVRFLLEMAGVWPNWLAELQGGVLLRRDELGCQLPPEAESGFVIHRDMQMRDRFHVLGAFEDEDGSAPINVWILGWDDAWIRVDFVVDLLPPSPFLARVLDCVARSIAASAMRIEGRTATIRYLTPMDPAWVRAGLPEIVKLEANLPDRCVGDASLAQFVTILADPDAPGACTIETPADQRIHASSTASVERAIVRLLGYWHSISYPDDMNAEKVYSMPPGELRVREGRVEILGGGRRLDWNPREVPTLFKKSPNAVPGG